MAWSHEYSSPAGPRMRSEEHTSELQSRSDIVCRLLLEKKKSYRGGFPWTWLPVDHRQHLKSSNLRAQIASFVRCWKLVTARRFDVASYEDQGCSEPGAGANLAPCIAVDGASRRLLSAACIWESDRGWFFIGIWNAYKLSLGIYTISPRLNTVLLFFFFLNNTPPPKFSLLPHPTALPI